MLEVALNVDKKRIEAYYKYQPGYFPKLDVDDSRMRATLECKKEE